MIRLNPPTMFFRGEVMGGAKKPELGFHKSSAFQPHLSLPPSLSIQNQALFLITIED
jgi:hypothetical protein